MPSGKYIRTHAPIGARSPRKAIHVIGPSIAYIELTQGQYSLVDSEDADRVSSLNWSATMAPKSKQFYDLCNAYVGAYKQTTVQLHRFILGITDKAISVDHINTRMTLDNRKSNLRAATASQQNFNKHVQRNNTSGYKGVGKRENSWTATICAQGRRIFLGHYKTPELAYAAYCEAAAKYHGDFARVA